MSVIQVQGLRPLHGEIFVQGSKNAVLPMMAAALLHKGITVIDNVPRIQDVDCMMGILKSLGCDCTLDGHRLTIDASQLEKAEISREDMVKMRSSIILLGPLLTRVPHAVTYYPGGCSIGKRPINLHLYALERLGVRIEEEDGRIDAYPEKLRGADIYLTFPSVGATENALLAAVMADGITMIRNCAREPEIEELCHFLCNMGARIEGIGSGMLVVYGNSRLHDSVYRVGADRIVTGTYLAAAMISMGQMTVLGINPQYLREELKIFGLIGGKVRTFENAIHIESQGRPLPTSVKTGPYPAFPTDMQSPILSVFCVANGICRIEETIFEDRFSTGDQLKKMGADIRISENIALVSGVYPLRGASVKAPDLRGGAALVLAALAAEGITRIEDCQHIFRGYQDICGDLRSLGADISPCQ